MGPYDRPGCRSPTSDLEFHALESEPVEPSPHTPADAVRCDSCDSLRASNAQLRLQIEHLTSENARLNLRLEELLASSRTSGDPSWTHAERVRMVFSAEEADATPLLCDPVVLLRALRYHEQRLDALVNLQSSLENELRSRS